MKRRIPLYVVAVAMAAGQCGPTVVRADDVPRQGMTQDEKTAQNVVPSRRATQILNQDVFNNEGKKIGHTKDFVTDQNITTLQYVVIGTGGALGMGEKLHAVPYQKIQFRGMEPDKLYADLPEKQINEAPVIENDKWPDFSNNDVKTSMNNYYSVKEDQGLTPEQAKDNMNRRRVNNEGTEKMGLLWCRRASAILGANVRSNTNEDLGQIKDMVVDLRNGKVQYAVLSFGGVLGMGDKLFAIPSQLLHTEVTSERFVINVSQDSLKHAPGFEKNAWPNFADPDFKSKIDTYYMNGERASTDENAK